MRRASGLLSAAALLAASWVWANEPTLTERDALGLANTFVEANGIRLDEYAAPKIKYEAQPNSQLWLVFYERKPDEDGVFIAGGYFWVAVNDATRKAKFHQAIKAGQAPK